MKEQNLIVINGRTYDARTGMIINSGPPKPELKKVFRDIAPSAAPNKMPQPALVRRPDRKPAIAAPAKVLPAQPAPQGVSRTPVASKAVHRNMQKTQTLQRHVLRRPDIATTRPAQPAQLSRQEMLAARQQRAMTTQKPAQINKFHAPVAAVKAPVKKAERPAPNIALAQLQSQQLAAKKQQTAPKPAVVSGPALKEQLIAKRLAETTQTPAEREERFQSQQHKVQAFFARQPKVLSAALGAICVLVFVGYVTYLNMPGLSMRLAANRAGFAATMPNYKPSGYSLKGTVTHSPGQVSLNYSSNTNHKDFTLNQKESNWDSQALLENYISEQTDNYLTYQEKGLTIYIHDGKADWVNGGIWYSVQGDAELSSDQILKLAASM